jgi:hypothetical protein
VSAENIARHRARVEAKAVAAMALLGRLALTTGTLDSKVSAKGGFATEADLNEVLEVLSAIGRDAEKIRRG